jgi:hypothetical protein
MECRVINKSGSIIGESEVTEFESHLHGELIRPAHAAYDSARRVWNGMIDRYPSLIVYCQDESDVLNAVNFARNSDILVAVRSGGHNVAGNSVCDGGIVIDLSRMKQMDIDTSSLSVSAQAGLTLGELDSATQVFGLATPLGIVSRTGMAGLALGGGIGWLMRRYGLTCDNLHSVDIVTADGNLITADMAAHKNLFWGVRGGGGNFGIVTTFRFSLHPVKEVLGGTVYYPAEKAKEAFRFYRDYISNVPDELTTMFALFIATPPLLPKRMHGTPLVCIHACFTGPAEKGKDMLKPVREFGPPLADTIKVMPYIKLQSMLDSGSPPGLLNYWKSSYLDSLNDDVIDTIINRVSNMPSPLTQVHIQHLQGAVSRIGEGETPFSHRNALCALNIVSKWVDHSDSEMNIFWTRDFAEALAPHSSGVYVNFLGDEGSSRIKDAYSRANYDRLLVLKKKYDPANFFSLNQNIKPAG